MGHKEDQAIREQEVVRRVCCFLGRQNLNYYFGFSSDDVSRLSEVFSSLEQNDDTTFPDFYGPNACVEVFSISSSASGKCKGFAQMRQDGELRAEIERDHERAVGSGNLETRTYTRIHPEHSYEDLTKNLHGQMTKHVESKRSSGKRFDTSVFVIELDELDLSCVFCTPAPVDLDGLCIGDLTPVYSDGKPHGPYRLSRDRENLEWLVQYAKDVDYVVFCMPDLIEAINLHHVREIVAFLPWRLVAAGNVSSTLVTSIPLVNEEQVSSYEQD